MDLFNIGFQMNMKCKQERRPLTAPRVTAQGACARAGAEAEKIRLWQEGRLAVR